MKKILIATLCFIFAYLLAIPLSAQNTVYYGITSIGGSNQSGTIIKFDPSTNTEQVVWNFGGGGDGNDPGPENLVYFAGNGLFYGMTARGGTADLGTIFTFNPVTNTEQVLWSFSGNSTDGSQPLEDLVYDADNGLFYGTTSQGGLYTYGTIFTFNPATNVEKVVWNFGQNFHATGTGPVGNLVYYPGNGLFYGLTAGGGNGSTIDCSNNGCGTIFSFDPSTNAENQIWSFGNVTGDGAVPRHSFIYDTSNGMLYATTEYGGSSVDGQAGTIIGFNPSTNAEEVVWNFGTGSSGSLPISDLVYCPANGLYYVTTNEGGSNGKGAVVTFNATNNTANVAYSFGARPDGEFPVNDLVYNAANGMFYGMIYEGGSSTNCSSGYGCGAIIGFNPATNTEGVLWNFESLTDGAWPAGNLVPYTPCDTLIVAAITGPTTLCAGSQITLADDSTGGTWSSSNNNIATINTSGMVSGVAAGTDTITYSITNGCSTTSVIYPVTVNAVPTVNAVSNQSVCAGDTTTTINFTGTGTGTTYNWVSSNHNIGLAASGTGNIASFTAVNTGNTPVIDTITVTPVGAGGYAYIPIDDSDYVSVINTATNTVVDTIHVGNGPVGVALSPDGSKVYVTSSNNTNTVSVINTATNLVTATINVGISPVGIAVSPDGSKVYVADLLSPYISVINATSNLVTTTINVPTAPLGITVSPDGSKVYVTRNGIDTVSVINTATNLVAATIVPGGGSAGGVLVSPDGSKVYVSGEDSVSVINIATNTVSASINLGNNEGGGGISISPDRSKLYVAGGNSVKAINTATNTITSIINVGNGVYGLSISPDGSKVYVASTYGKVFVISTASNTVIDSIAVGNGALSLGNFVTDGNGCTGTPITFTITVNPIPTAGITGTGTGCGMVTLIATGGGTYAWSGGISPITQGNSFTNSNTYTVTVTGTGSCTATVSAAVTVNTVPTAGITGTATGCGSVLLTATGGGTYAWSGGNSPNTAANTFSSSNTYTVTVTGTGSCTATASEAVTVNTVPTAGITGTATGCGSVSLTATGGGTYAWSGGNSVNTAANTFSSSNTYMVTVTGAGSCTATANQAVTVNTIPTATITNTGATTFCTGDSVILTASTANGYTWSNTATTQSITVKQTGNYTVIVSSAAGCSATSTATVVTVNSLPVAAINGPTDICSGLNATLTASGGTSYNWSGGLGTNAQITVSPVSTTPYTVTVTNANNCSATATQTVSVTSTPTASITGATQVCNGSSVTLTANGGNTYNWANSLGSNAAIMVSPTQTTVYTVTATIGVNCSATATQTVTVNQPAASQFSHAVCAGQTYSFNNTTLTQSGAYNDTLQTINGCDSIVTLNLTVNSAIQTSLTDTACEGHAVIFNGQSLTQEGVYKDTLQSAIGCDSVVTLSLFINSATIPTITRSNDTLQTQTYSSYQWLLNGLATGNGTSQNLVVTQNGNYSVVVTNANGCTDTSSTISVTDVGIKDIATDYTVQLYPNPNNGNFTLQFSDNITRSVSITDVTGRVVVAAQQVAMHKEFDCSALAGGVYLLQINENTKVRNLKFVVTK